MKKPWISSRASFFCQSGIPDSSLPRHKRDRSQGHTPPKHNTPTQKPCQHCIAQFSTQQCSEDVPQWRDDLAMGEAVQGDQISQRQLMPEIAIGEVIGIVSFENGQNAVPAQAEPES